MQFINLPIDKPNLENRTPFKNVDIFSEHSRRNIFYFHHGEVICENYTSDQPKPLITKNLLDILSTDDIETKLYLGEFNDVSMFALNLKSLPQHYTTVALKELSENSEEMSENIAILGFASHLLYWLKFHKYCNACGNPFHRNEYSYILNCKQCKREHYPRINPAVIVQITCDHHIFLARQPKWPDKRYSVIAGFVEPGETLEQTVARETFEETNIHLNTTDISYFGSQPWPFPDALMLGFKAKAFSANYNLDNDELSHGFWIKADDLVSKIKSGEIIMPSSISISHQLIEDFIEYETGKSLNQHIANKKL